MANGDRISRRAEIDPETLTPESQGFLSRLMSQDFSRSQAEKGSAAETFAFELQQQLLSNILNVPTTAVNLLVRGAHGISSAITTPIVGPPKTEPALLPRIDPDRVIAGMRTVGQLAENGLGEGGLRGLFHQELEAVRSEREQRKAEHGTAAAVGNIGGDVATLIIGRAPFNRIRGSIPALKVADAEMAPGFLRASARLLNHPVTQRMLRGLGRAGESGLEGAALAALDPNADPLETATYAAGLQVGGSLSLEALKHARSHPGFAASVYLSAAILQMLKEATPGGRDYILESLESSAHKAAIIVGLGLLSGVSGRGRLTGTFSEDFPKVADALTTIPRGAITSLVKDLTQAEREARDELSVVIQTLQRDPDYFGETARDRLVRAMRDPARSFGAEVNRLLGNKDFRTRIGEARRTLAREIEEAQIPEHIAEARKAVARELEGGAPERPPGEPAPPAEPGAGRISLRQQLLGPSRGE